MNEVQILTIVVGVVIPLVVGLITKASWSSAVKAWLLAGASALTGFFTAWQGSGDGFEWQAAAVNSFVAFVAGVAAHYGFWKPVGATGVVQDTLIKD